MNTTPLIACLLARCAPSLACGQPTDAAPPAPTGATAAAASDSAATPVAAGEASAEPEGGLEDILFTSTRSAERLQDIPLTAMTMEAAGLTDIRNLTQVVPGFFGGRNVGLFLPVIRGVGSASAPSTAFSRGRATLAPLTPRRCASVSCEGRP